MNTLKTTAIVEDGNHLKLETNFENLKRGSQVDLIILIKQKKKKWEQVLKRIGVYTDDELSGIIEARKEINKWQPVEF
ncbi:hypothetical protein L0Z72_13345 [candidate division KSB1 bacterium]|jgi:hypothetical protein|nr:hypothetical protein [candidate division KSB1 bacterium]